MPLRFRHAALALLTVVAGPALANISDDPLTARVSERSAAPIRLAQRGCPHGFDADIYGRCLPTGMVQVMTGSVGDGRFVFVMRTRSTGIKPTRNAVKSHREQRDPSGIRPDRTTYSGFEREPAGAFFRSRSPATPAQ